MVFRFQPVGVVMSSYDTLEIIAQVRLFEIFFIFSLVGSICFYCTMQVEDDGRILQSCLEKKTLSLVQQVTDEII